RLSPLEQSLLYWLAVEREPVGVATLRADLAPGSGSGAVLEALEALGRRSLLERGAQGGTHTLQPVVLEYVGERLVASLAQEIVAGQPVLLRSHAVLQATAKDYVRQSQERLLARPPRRGRPRRGVHRLYVSCAQRGWRVSGGWDSDGRGVPVARGGPRFVAGGAGAYRPRLWCGAEQGRSAGR